MSALFKRFFAFLMVFTLVLSVTVIFTQANNTQQTETPEEKIERLEQELSGAKAEILSLYQSLVSASDMSAYLPVILEKLESLEGPPPPPLTYPRLIVREADIITLRQANVNTILKLSNVGVGSANNVYVKLDLQQNDQFAAIITGGTNYFRSVAAKASVELKIRIVPVEGAKPGLYILPLEYTYTDNNNAERKDTDIIFVRIADDGIVKGDANIAVTGFNASKSAVSPGEAFVLNADFENIGGKTASNVQVIISGLAGDEIYLDSGTGSYIYQSVAAGAKQTSSFALKAAKNASGVFPLSVKTTWNDFEGKAHENEYTYYAVISGGAGEAGANIKTGAITAPLAEVRPGEDFTVSIPVSNIGDTEADVTVSAKTDAEGAVVPRSASVQTLAALKPGETRTVYFTLMATEEAKTRNYTIGFAIDTGAEDKQPISQYAGVNVYNPKADEKEETVKSVPKIIISRYECSPLVVRAGENFDLTIAFQNTHQTRSIQNVKAYLTAPASTDGKGNVLIPVNASNTFYIDMINPKSESEKHLTFYTVPDAEPRNYIIVVNFEYEDSEGTEYTAIEQFGINVKQITRLETSDINIQADGYVGSPISVYFDFFNTGKVTLNNLMIRIEGEFDTTNTTSYYSNFQPGAYDMYDMMFYPNEPGFKTGNVVFQYEDDSGETITEYKEFTVNVMDMGGFDIWESEGGMEFFPEDIYTEEEKGGFIAFIKKPIVIILGSVVILIIALAVIFKIRRSRRRRRELENDE